MSDNNELVKVFKALSAETRIRIVQLLRGRALCVGALAARLDVTQGAVSQHLRVLRDADLVTAEKRGYYVHYRLNEKTLTTWQHATTQLLGAELGTPRRCPGNRSKNGDTGVCI